MRKELTEIIEELERAYAERGDVPLDGVLLDLAAVAIMLSEMKGGRGDCRNGIAVN